MSRLWNENFFKLTEMDPEEKIIYISRHPGFRYRFAQAEGIKIFQKQGETFMKEFDRIIGYAEEKLELERVCDIMRNPEKYQKLGVETPVGMLIKGDPGLGKTLMAQCFVEASGLKTFICRKNKPAGDFVKEIRQTFEEAKAAAPSIVYLDDMDKFANDDPKHKNSDAFITIQSCIDDVRGKGVFVLATANERFCIPDSLLRAGRFDRIIEIDAPEHDDAVKIIEHYLSKKKYVTGIDIEEITRIMSGRSCAELESVINEAGIAAGFAGKENIGMDDIVRACLRVLFDAPEMIKTTGDSFKDIAYHEAGHVVCGELLEPGSVTLVSVAAHTGSTGGITSYYKNPHELKSKDYIEKRIIRDLGGRAATEIMFGKTDVGATHDLHDAFNMAEKLVDDYCTYGFGMFERNNSGNSLINRKETAMALELERLYLDTKRMLIENREFLDRIAAALIGKKTLLRKDIEEIRKTCRRVKTA